MKRLAFLMTVHNRKKKTLKSLELMYKSFEFLKNENDYLIDVFVTDDGSTDGTSSEISSMFPSVTIIKGNGHLFWNQGMRLAWKTAVKKFDYDFYVLLNDDTFLIDYALADMLKDYKDYKEKNKQEIIVIGACAEDKTLDKFSYGLRKNNQGLIPNGSFQEGNMMNGNIVLISKKIFKRLGFLSSDYTHAMGDYDYGLRALEEGFKLITTRRYIAICKTNKKIPVWMDTNSSLLTRWRSLYSPLGLNIMEYRKFRRRFWNKTYYLDIAKVYVQTIVPRLYNIFKKT